MAGEQPGLSMTDVTKEIAALWRAKTNDEKKVFQVCALAITNTVCNGIRPLCAINTAPEVHVL